MKGVTRAEKDKAGGEIIPTQFGVYINEYPVSVIGDPVTSHGDNKHAAAVMIEGHESILINGVPIVFEGCLADCGDVAEGSDSVMIE